MLNAFCTTWKSTGRKRHGVLKAVSEGPQDLVHSSVTQSSLNIPARDSRENEICLSASKNLLSDWIPEANGRKVSKNARWYMPSVK